jgi:peroxiredoxin
MCLAIPATAQEEVEQTYGHSSHGSAFDKGLRTKPWKMEGIGESHFPVTTSNPEVQEWFDQGNSLMHSFWFEEAERSFRWCAKLDPDCASAYWGMARVGLNWFSVGGGGGKDSRFKDFLKKAVELKDQASPREQMFIQAWADVFLPEKLSKRSRVMVDALQGIVDAYPDDIEAKALLCLYSINVGDPEDNERRIKEVFAEHPDHPGAHHYLIHNWDGRDPIRALKSCEEYGEDVPGIGHANHMPGHVYSKIGMWKEAAMAMDAATRVEHKYMLERMKLPFETWNFAHNRNYLCYIQEHLGQADAAIAGARDLLNAPLDPDDNQDGGFGPHGQGRVALIRALIRFERWEEILEEGSIPWIPGRQDKQRIGVETLALLGLGRTAEARKKLDEVGWRDDGAPNLSASLRNEVYARLLMAEGKSYDALELIQKDAEREAKRFDRGSSLGDPPGTSAMKNLTYGELLLERGKNREAIDAFQIALKGLPGEALAYAGLSLAHHRLGNAQEAADNLGHLKYLYEDADDELTDIEYLEGLGIESPSLPCSPKEERTYTSHTLDHIGPLNWAPFAAPDFNLQNTKEEWVSLADYRGKNIIMVFYLSDECVHCVEQLQQIVLKEGELNSEDTVVIAVSSTTPAKNLESLELIDLPLQLLSDTDHENARRYQSYDDFEDIELHSTILIDKEGRVRWKRTGGDPFMGIDFLLNELRRINREALPEVSIDGSGS